MTKLYKLTDGNGQTRNNTQWGENVTHKAKPGKGGMCSEYWIHAYEDPLQAVFFNPIHADINHPQLWESKGRIGIRDKTKCGCKTLTTISQIELPEMTTTQRVAAAILAVKQACKDPDWNNWADKWLSGKDRSAWAAWAAGAAGAPAAAAAWEAARAAAAAAAWEAARAAEINIIPILHRVVKEF